MDSKWTAWQNNVLRACLKYDGHICNANRRRKYFCDDSICKMGINCRNRFTSSIGAYELLVRNEGRLGFGLMLGSKRIKKENEYLGEYTGQIRSNCYNLNGSPPIYTMRLSRRYIVEAKDSSHVLKFINHSCNPNTKSEVWFSYGKFISYLWCVYYFGKPFFFNL